ncbi:MAG: ribbon-helix-helix protein, CopG family [Rhodocyclaceae bacterium]|nr:ribbon-helix-helix protein, CopG family [Rhodocyclaceae bacterium]
MLAIRLPETIEERLNALASETGRSKTALVREAILEYIDDLEDYYLAEARARRNRKTHSAGRSGAQAWPMRSSSIPRPSGT